MKTQTSLLLLLVTACSPSELEISAIQADLELGPPLTDVGTLPLGQAQAVELRVDHLYGPDARLRTIEVLPIVGDCLVYDGESDLTLTQSGLLLLPFTFQAQEAGPCRALVQIVAEGSEWLLEAEVRGVGGQPDLQVFPRAVDLGAVASGEAAEVSLGLRNLGLAPVLVTEALFSDPAFALTLPLPFEVGAGTERLVTVRFLAPDEVARSASLTLRSAETDLPDVRLLVNDCLNGLPEAWDDDLDGVTVCGGDCDDTTRSIAPGREELPDGRDQDCDGRTDEGTTAADDDGDGWCEGPTCTDGSRPGDCDDTQPEVSPDQPERLINGRDDDCDGVVDEGQDDLDADGHSPLGGDCDDLDPTVGLGFPELPDGLDNDCDEDVDEGTRARDDDGDGWCEGPTCTDGSTPGDCDDDDLASYPGAAELPDRRDQDCDGRVDEGTELADDDGDGWTEAAGDCDDEDPDLHPGAGCG